jgi:hypothetical protein
LNLGAQFEAPSSVDHWLHHGITSLGDVEVPSQVADARVGPSTQVGLDKHAEPTTWQPPPDSVFVPCLPNGPNSSFGRVLPDEVWVDLRIMGYDSVQWYGLTQFLGEVQQKWTEDGVHWYGIEFGGSIG